MFYRTCRRILPLTLALLLIISCVPIAYTADFSDVPRSHWAPIPISMTQWTAS